MKISGSLFYSALLLFLLGGASLPAQSRAELLFHKAYNSRFKDTTIQSRPIYEEIIANHSKSAVYPLALYQFGHLLLEEGEQERAMSLFRELVENDFSGLGEEGEEKVGKKEMKERYTIYKHSAALQLARWHIEARRFQKALEYIGLADSVHVYQSFCGNGLAGRRVTIARMYADCYEGMENVDEAIRVLKPYAEYSSYENRDITKRYFRLISTRYTRGEQRRLAEDALAELHLYHEGVGVIETLGLTSWIIYAYTDLLGHRIFLAPDDEAMRTGRLHSALSNEEWLEYYRGMLRKDEYYKFFYNGEH